MKIRNGEDLRDYRKHLGLSRVKFAKLLGLGAKPSAAAQQVYNIENGIRPVPWAALINCGILSNEVQAG